MSDKNIKSFVAEIIAQEGPVVKRDVLLQCAASAGIPDKVIYKELCQPALRAATRGHYDLTRYGTDAAPVKQAFCNQAQPVVTERPVSAMDMVTTYHNEIEQTTYVPDVNGFYVRWGAHGDVEKIIRSKQFFPIYVAGPSGNGKTMMIEQACAKAKREYIRVNLSPETDEDDLIGGFRLKDGNTVFAKGPVIRAMEAGAVLLLDELDRATNKIMCLQSVLEGNAILLKKTGETIHPRPGFTVIATANTSGRGSEDGRYSAATIIDDAFLERFPIMINQPWPSKHTEKKIVLSSMERYDCVDDDFAEKLVTWSKIIRKTYEADGVDDVVSTRRLDHVVKAYGVFGNRVKSIELAVNRFSPETTEAFVDLYRKIDAGELVDDDNTHNTAGSSPVDQEIAHG